MSVRSIGVMMCGAALVVVACAATPVPAAAEFGISIGGIPIGIFHGGGYRRYGRYGRHRGRGPRDEAREESRGDEVRPGKPDKVVATEGAPSSAEQTKALRRIASIATVSVSSAKDINEVGQQS